MEQTLDAFLGGVLMVAQPKTAYRAGIDAVLLAAVTGALKPAFGSPSPHILDAGAGVGVVGLAIAARCPEARVTLVEREADLVALARANIVRNGLEARVRVEAADLLMRPGAGGPDVADQSVDHLAANPPFYRAGAHRASPDALKAGAHGMAVGDLDGWFRFAARVLRPGGTLALIHLPESLPGLLAAAAGRFGGVRILPLHPRAGMPANRVIVMGVKGSRAPMQLHQGLVLHGEGRCFTPAVEAVLRFPKMLDFQSPA